MPSALYGRQWRFAAELRTLCGLRVGHIEVTDTTRRTFRVRTSPSRKGTKIDLSPRPDAAFDTPGSSRSAPGDGTAYGALVNGEPAEAPPTALISWAHDSDAGAQLPKGADKQAADRQWLETVLDLVTHLRTIGGVDADVDVVHGAEPVDWSRWGPGKVQSSDFVLVAINKAWARRFRGDEKPNRGAGATAEADELLGLYERKRDVFDRKVIVVLLPGADEEDIPARLLGRVTRVWVNSFDEAGLEDLLRRIYDRPKYKIAATSRQYAAVASDLQPHEHSIEAGRKISGSRAEASFRRPACKLDGRAQFGSE